MAKEPPERIRKLAEKIEKDSPKESTPTPKMRIPRLYDIEAGLGIGDIMVLLTLMPGLKKKLPDWTIRFITEKPDWASLGYDYVITPKDFEASGARGERRFEQFDKHWVDYDLLAIEKKKLRHELFGERLGVTPQKITLNVRDDANYWANQVVVNKEKRKVVGIAPYASSEQRTWPDENWVRLVLLLVDMGYMPIMIGGPGEGERSKFYPCMRYWGMGAQRTAALLKLCDLVIGNDSGMAHVAGMLNVPTLALGAVTDIPRIFGWYDSVTPVTAKADCAMCYWRRERGFRQECNYRCRLIAMIEPKEIATLVRQALTT